MYLRSSMKQIGMFDFNCPFGFPIDESNRWVKLSEQIPWDSLEDIYAEQFNKMDGTNTGNVAIPFRVALGSLIIRRVMHLSDRNTVKNIQENPYLQFFLGVSKYTSVPLFDPSMMTHFRKRLDLDAMKEITDQIIEFEKKTSADAEHPVSDNDVDSAYDMKAESDTDYRKSMDMVAEVISAGILRGAITRREAMFLGSIPNSGELIIDATCCPVNIRYPQDYSLLNEARDKIDAIISRICKATHQKKPRTYCRVARQKYLELAKKKKRTKKEIRKVVRFMLSCVRRNLRYLDNLLNESVCLESKEEWQVETIRKLYDQQKYMYDNDTTRVDNRIVSIHMPFIRPIVRGKTPNPTEFGPKMDISVDTENNSRIEYYSYEAYNESGHLIDAVEGYYARTGHFPERVLADQIYRNKKNRRYCEVRNIRLSGPKLGRPSKEESESKQHRKQTHQDMIDRIEVERHFSRTKRCFGLDLIMEKLEETVGCSAALGILLDNIIPVGF